MIALGPFVASMIRVAPAGPVQDPAPPAPAPTSTAKTRQPEQVVVRVDPIADTPPRPPPKADPAPEPDPTTDHYGIPSHTAGKTEVRKRPPPPKAVQSREAASRDAHVQLSEKGKTRDKRPGTPQRFELEVKVGPYLPSVDRRYDGPGLGPYAMIYGRTGSLGNANAQPKEGVMPVIGFDWQFLYLGGPIGIGTQIGFFRDRAQALRVVPADNGNLRSEADRTSFGMVPVALLATYRFEYLADELKIPLVPYAKGGLAYAFWWTKDGSGNISRNSRRQKGAGGVLGWQANGGLMLRLDFLEPSAAKTFDRLSGINHTYIFGEYQISRIANFGADNAIALGDGTWFGGLAIEF